MLAKVTSSFQTLQQTDVSKVSDKLLHTVLTCRKILLLHRFGARPSSGKTRRLELKI